MIVLVFNGAACDFKSEQRGSLDAGKIRDCKEWYFVRVYDAVPVCLHYVESKNQTPTNVEESSSSSLWRRCSAKNSVHTEVESDTNLVLKEPSLFNEK
ncbi:unnamed protein product [Brassica oleracea]|uniref:(rape) hypothetical protein n=1 Tax=Brassica napus TaxID=3708 RepID=A0A816IB25_BRANA|nr:unnamed protein product [Brassica napus]